MGVKRHQHLAVLRSPAKRHCHGIIHPGLDRLGGQNGGPKPSGEVVDLENAGLRVTKLFRLMIEPAPWAERTMNRFGLAAMATPLEATSAATDKELSLFMINPLSGLRESP